MGVEVLALMQVYELIRQIGALFANLFSAPDWRTILDIAIMTVLIYQAMKLVLRTRASSVFKGIGVVLVLAWISDILQINTLNWLLQQVLNTGVIVLVILFQPELRRALEQIGRSNLPRHMLSSVRRQHSSRTDEHVSEIVKALNNMARKRIGALIVIERRTALGDVIESGTIVDADISAPLIENIFEPNTPLHDGAMIIRNRRINAAACILPLSEDPSISRELGTRHRAAIGITETTDAVSLIVSEETGIISMAREGRLTRHMDARSLTILLTELFTPDRSMYAWLGTLRREDHENEA